MRQNLLSELLEDAGISANQPKETDGGYAIVLRCPFAPYMAEHKFKPDNRPSMGILVPPAGPIKYNCYTCGKRGNSDTAVYGLFRRLSYYDDTFSEFLQRAKEVDYQTPAQIAEFYENSIKEIGEITYVDIDVEMSKYLDVYHSRYLAPRGVDQSDWSFWDLRYDLQRSRILLPVLDVQGRVRGAAGRSVIGQQPKYLNYGNYAKSDYLYGEFIPKRIGNFLADILLVEGQFDAIIANKYLLPYYKNTVIAMATQGCSLSLAQKNKLISFAKSVTLGYDPNKAGASGQEAVARALYGRVPLFKLPVTEDTRDPADLREKIIELFTQRERIQLPKKRPTWVPYNKDNEKNT